MTNETKLITDEILYRTRCTDCKFSGKCYLYGNRMIKKRCYIDKISEKLKIKPETFIKKCNNFLMKYYTENFYFLDDIDKNYWLMLSISDRIKVIRFYLKYFADRENVSVENEDIKISYTVANCYFSSWSNEEYIKCAKCGKVIKNSKQRNRKYCDDCKSKSDAFKSEKIKICIDCGEKFEAYHNREVRCYECQIEANKASTRERARRYRERKRNGLEIKS